MILAGVALATLAGCGFTGSATAVQAPISLRGTVLGGQRPVSGSSVQLYAAGISGNGSASQPLLSDPVVSDSNGNFSVPASYRCPSASSQVYVLARGGNPGLASNTDNPAIALTAVLGSCDSLSSTAPILVNEVTTVGSVWPLAPYLKSPIDLGSAPDEAAFQAAVSSVSQFVNLDQGSSPGVATPNSFFTENSKLYTLADVLDKCVSSSGGSAGDGTPCGMLFSIASLAGGGSALTDTFSAALRIAQNPESNVTAIFGLATAPTPFQPALTAAPEDWTLNLSHPVATPSISPATGTYVGIQEVTMGDSTAGSEIYYTTDGTVPTSSSALYSGALSIGVSSTVQAIAVLGESQSSVASSTLTIAATHPPAQLAFVQQPSDALTEAAIAPAVRVTVEDANGNVVSSSTNLIRVNLTGIYGLGGKLEIAARNGIATFSNLAVNTAGSGYTLTASSPGLTSATSTAFTISAPVSATATTAQAADDFVDSVGINVHFSYLGCVYTTQTPQMLSYLGQLNVRHLRDQMVAQGVSSLGNLLSAHNQIGAMGMKTDYGITSIDFPISQATAYPTLVNDMEAVEASNEYDASGDPAWAAKIKAQQTALYSQIHSSTLTQHMTVIAPSLAQPQNAFLLGDISAISDTGDSHAYFEGWNPGNAGVGENNPAYFMRLALVNVPDKPVWVTETGFWTVLGMYYGGAGNGEALSATYLPRALLEFWLAGAKRTYIYDLADCSGTEFFGLIRNDGSPKPGFYAISNLLTLLSDPGSPFTPGALSYSLSGASSQLHQVLLQKRDGSYYLALWIEAPGMDANTLATISVPSTTIQVLLGHFPSTVTSYQWSSAGTMTKTGLTASQTISVPVGPNITVLEIQ